MNESTNEPDDVCESDDRGEPTSEMHAEFFADGGCTLEASGPGLYLSVDLDGTNVGAIGRLVTELGPQLAALLGQASPPVYGQAVIYPEAGDVGEPSIGPRWHHDQFGLFDDAGPIVLEPTEIEQACDLFVEQRRAGATADEAAAFVCEVLSAGRGRTDIRYEWLNSAVVASIWLEHEESPVG